MFLPNTGRLSADHAALYLKRYYFLYPVLVRNVSPTLKRFEAVAGHFVSALPKHVIVTRDRLYAKHRPNTVIHPFVSQNLCILLGLSKSCSVEM